MACNKQFEKPKTMLIIISMCREDLLPLLNRARHLSQLVEAMAILWIIPFMPILYNPFLLVICNTYIQLKLSWVHSCTIYFGYRQIVFPLILPSMPEKLKEFIFATNLFFSSGVNRSINSCRKYFTGPSNSVCKHSTGVEL